MSMMSLKDRLRDWTDWDGAAYEVGAALGLWPEFGSVPGEDCWNGKKHVMWSNNPLGNALHEFLVGLVRAGLLEEESSGEKFRWKPENGPVG